MDSFTDYYAVLGVATDASASTIKAAFKKLALQYHPDVYKGADAHERMRVLLLAYQTLSDPVERKAYDARHAEHVLGNPARYKREASQKGRPGNKGSVTPAARRDRQRHYAFPDIRNGQAAEFDLGDVSYSFSPTEAQVLMQQGMLRGVVDVGMHIIAPKTDTERYCHRCHHRWIPAPIRNRPDGTPSFFNQSEEQICPACRSDDWDEYLLLRCVHCCAVFESEQIRYEVGSINYGDGSLCPPYELFPLCPYCGVSGWCPAENARVSALRAEAARRAARVRLVWLSLAVLVLVLGGVMFTVLR